MIRPSPSLAALLAASLLVACGRSEAPPLPKGEGAPAIDAPGALPAFFDCVRESGATLVSAHRAGAYPGYPENALETMENVAGRMPALIEVDVATTADGALVLMHDDTLQRTTTGVGAVTEHKLKEIRSLRLEDEDGDVTDFVAPTLADALAWAEDRAIVQIDIKRSTDYEDVVDAVRAQGAQDRVIYIAYTLPQALKLNALAPQSMVSLAVEEIGDLDEAEAAGLPLAHVLAWTGLETTRPDLYDALRARGVEVIFGTLGGERSIDMEIENSGDAGRYREIAADGVTVIATDRPLEAYAALHSGLLSSTPDASACGVAYPRE